MNYDDLAHQRRLENELQAMNRESEGDKEKKNIKSLTMLACVLNSNELQTHKLTHLRTCKFSMLLSLEIDDVRCKSLGGKDLL